MAATQTALVVTAIGQPLTLIHNHPIPSPGPNQVQLRVSVAGINPHDQKARDTGLFIAGKLPAVLANDVVGTITSLGPDVSGLTIGDRIVSHATFTPGFTQQGLQEYALADTVALAKIPEGMTDDEAATLPTNIIAPLFGLFASLKIPAPWAAEAEGFDYAGATVLVIGGGSNCGKFAVQLAALAGIGRIVVVGGQEAELKGFGATHVVDRHGGHDAVLGRIREIVGDELVFALDAVTPPPEQTLVIDALSNTKRGGLARLLHSGAPFDASRIKGKTAGFDVHNVIGLSQLNPGLAGPFWERVLGYLETGKIKPLGYEVVEGLTPEGVNPVFDGYRDKKRVVKTHVHL